MSYPAIGTTLQPKRGRKVPPATVRQIHRADRMISLVIDGERRTMKLAEVRKLYRLPKGTAV